MRCNVARYIDAMSRWIETISPGGKVQPTIVSGAAVMRCLGIVPNDLAEGMVTVSVQPEGLRRLLMEIARQQPFDIEFYAETYPDIEAARLAGMVGDLHVHYCETGFFEGRLPCAPPFDPDWYAAYYPDLASVFAPGDVAGLWNHFISAGLAEGRAGTEATLAQASRWVSERSDASDKG